jgi:hypothetical protein
MGHFFVNKSYKTRFCDVSLTLHSSEESDRVSKKSAAIEISSLVVKRALLCLSANQLWFLREKSG